MPSEALIRLHERWSESSLGAHVRRYVSWYCGSFIKNKIKLIISIYNTVNTKEVESQMSRKKCPVNSQHVKPLFCAERHLPKILAPTGDWIVLVDFILFPHVRQFLWLPVCFPAYPGPSEAGPTLKRKKESDPAGTQVDTTSIQRWFNVLTLNQRWIDVFFNVVCPQVKQRRCNVVSTLFQRYVPAGEVCVFFVRFKAGPFFRRAIKQFWKSCLPLPTPKLYQFP